ncbi:hypothetical protein DdX_00299 [Ditylenchus destructor]|uniref:Uncharacterized protein n=1 Tax=Ditylenchus destructor TaxID=166010 RepID=A0AAD4NJP0_9BILA|nr:hypothetical protein DdX_00299 [Ditylenchus destructor]
MFNQTGEKLATLQTKIRAIHGRLDTTSTQYTKCSPTSEYAQSSSSCAGSVASHDVESANQGDKKTWGGVGKRFIKRIKEKLNEMRDSLRRQRFYAHCVKLLTLFAIALVHVIYMHPFLEMFSALEDYSTSIESKLQTESRQPGQPQAVNVLKTQIDVLNDYKKNVWMTVAAMCVALSSSCFFLFILPATKIRRFHVILVGSIDVIAFATLPALLIGRAELVEATRHHLSEVLRVSHKYLTAERLMNTVQCTIHPREKLPFCSDLILKSILPVVLLKYLLIVCILTLVYLLIAYIIDWIIKHWFPPHCSVANCCCCGCSPENAKDRYNRAAVSSCGACCSYESPTLWRLESSREYNSKSYLPAVLLPPNWVVPVGRANQIRTDLSKSSEAECRSPFVLSATQVRNRETIEISEPKSNLAEEEPIPAEPKPSDAK